MSPSTRRAWIEIEHNGTVNFDKLVALHPEGVDRNDKIEGVIQPMVKVALHPEGVDRNHKAYVSYAISRVALHPEGVDRNFGFVVGQLRVICRPPPGGRG